MNSKIIFISLWSLLGLALFFSGCEDFTHIMIQLTSEDEISASHPVWSPSGDTIVFGGADETAGGLFTMDSQGGNLTLLLSTEDMDHMVYTLIPNDYSDDGYLLFSDGLNNIYYLPPRGIKPVFICQGFGATVKGKLDGTYNIAYIKYNNTEEPVTEGLYLSDIHGSEAQLVVQGHLFSPHWSPDGNCITYIREILEYSGSASFNRTSQLCLFFPETQEEKVIYESYDTSSSPRWSYDGQWIAFTMKYSGISKREVYIIPAEGGDPIRLTEFPYDPSHPAPGAGSLFWSPDGKWIVYDLLTRELWKVSVE